MAGGYRQPRNPAGVSGPGKLARRTDGGPAQKMAQLPDAQYGEAATFTDLQRQAPLEQAAPASSSGARAPKAKPQLPTPLTAPTTRPEEPVTAGADAGSGPGLASLNLPPQPIAMQPSLIDTLSQLHPYDVTGAIADLIAQANYRSK